MTAKPIKCNCSLDYGFANRVGALESAANGGDLNKLKFALAHIQSYDYMKDPDALFKRVEQRLQEAVIPTPNQSEALKKIANARKAIATYQARMKEGIPPRRSDMNRTGK